MVPVGNKGILLTRAAAKPGLLKTIVLVSERGHLHALSHALWTPAAWDGLDGGSELGLAIARCNGLLQQAGLQPPLGDQPDRSLSQPAISHRLREVHVLAWKAAAGTDDVCRLHACSAESTVLNLVPSRVLDTNLSKDDFLTCLGGRLGVDVCLGGGVCRFCGLPMDVKGRHPQSCMAGGDAVALHNGLRDLLHDYCARAQLRPQAEAPGLLGWATAAC